MMDEEYKSPDTGQEEQEATEIPIENADTETSEEVNESAEETAESEMNSEEATAEGTSDAGETSEAGETEKKGFFSRGKKADKEKNELKEKIETLEDRVRRQMAEFDNFRKRTDKEKEQMFSMGEKNVIEKILPIVDNFERGFDTVEATDEEDAFVEGMRKIYSQMVKQLEAFGVTPIEAVGKEFDPNLHNAVMQVESDEFESGIVAQELQKGYMYHDQVLRHSMVAVVS